MVGLRVDCYSISYIDIHSVSLQRLTTMTWMLVALSTVLELAIAQNSGQVPPVVIPGAVGTADLRACPMEEETKIVRDIIHNAVMDILQPPPTFVVPNCGAGLWHQVAFLNMSDPTQQCPSVWREFIFDGIRVCA